MTSVPPPNSNPAISKAEFRWMIAAVIFGAIVRLSFPGRIAVEHFDEGVYASNFWFDAESGYSYPARYLYAPPLLPAAIEWTMTIASLIGVRPIGFIPMIPSLIAGIATIPSLWWVCRQWYGPTAGLVAAWLVSTSDFHASYSRAALTDVPLCLFILWSVHFLGSAVRHVSSAGSVPPTRHAARISENPFLPWREIGLAGVFTGLAWSTKYNGWLPLAVGFSGVGLWQLMTPYSQRRISGALACCVLVSLVAFAVWSPVLWGLQKYGGYQVVSNNHRNYLIGFQGWGTTALQQLTNISQYENPFDVLYKPFQPSPHPLSPPSNPSLEVFWVFVDQGQWLLAFVIGRAYLFERIIPVVLPLILLLVSLWVSLREILTKSDQNRKIWSCLIASWLMGLTVMTPFYYPYPRLVLPWLCAIWICLGLTAQHWTERVAKLKGKKNDTVFRGGVAIAVTSLAITLAIRLGSGCAHAWTDRTSIQQGARDFAATVRTETTQSRFPKDEAFVYVLGEPALVFGLKGEGLPAVGPAQDLGFMTKPIVRPTFVAFPPRDSAMTREQREDLGSSRFERVAGFVALPSDLVRFDDPWRVQTFPPVETKLYRLIK